MIAAELVRLGTLGHHLEVSLSAVEFLIRLGYHKTLGARPMRGVVERCLQEAVASSVLNHRPGSGRIVADTGTERLVLVEADRATAFAV